MKLQTILKHIIFAFCSKRKGSNDASSCHKTKKIQLATSNHPNLLDADNFRNQSTNAVNFGYDLSSFLSGIGNSNSSNNKKLTSETGNIGNDDLFDIENFVKQIEPSSTDDFNRLETDISALYSPNSIDDYQNFSIESCLNIDPIDFIQATESGLREDMLTPDSLTDVNKNRKIVCPSFSTKDMSDFISEKQKDWLLLVILLQLFPQVSTYNSKRQILLAFLKRDENRSLH